MAGTVTGDHIGRALPSKRSYAEYVTLTKDRKLSRDSVGLSLRSNHFSALHELFNKPSYGGISHRRTNAIIALNLAQVSYEKP